jgi:hypothetical protein
MLKTTIPLFLILLFFAGIAQAQKWQPGHFYGTDGTINSGFIADYIAPPNGPDPDRQFFLFKRNPNDEPMRVFAANITSFIVARDSFVVSDSKLLTETPFVKVVGNGPLKLYITSLPRQTPTFGLGGSIGFLSVAGASSFPYTKNKYYYGHDPDNLTELSRKDFTDVVSSVMADKPEIAEKVKNKTYRYGDIKELIVYYQTGVAPGYNVKPEN